MKRICLSHVSPQHVPLGKKLDSPPKPLVGRDLFMRIMFATDLSQPPAKLLFRRDDGCGDILGCGLQSILQGETR
jgi:hypothetical protein